jgi:tetraacyldisaccharide 4'-kinase
MSLADRLVAGWYAPRLTPLCAALLPLSLLFRVAVSLRRAAYRARLLPGFSPPVPTAVVGNIVVGGAGKTPLTRALAEVLATRGWRPGIVSRGYGSGGSEPRAVSMGDDAAEVGDEPLLLATSGFPVWIGHDRAAAARALLAAHPDRDVLLSDDGLQHYALHRDFEIAAIDASRGFGNGQLLPAGPLREPRSRLRGVDALVILVASSPAGARDGGRETQMCHEPLPWRNLTDASASADLSAWAKSPAVHAIAGIANPQRFFDLLRGLGLDPVCHAFPDHHRYTRNELALPGANVILMTEKDAVKCAAFGDSRFWCLPIRARIDAALVDRLERALHGREAA